MFLDLQIGELVDALTGSHWDRARVNRELRRRLAYFQSQGLLPQDRVFIHFGNCPEFFVDLLAIWSLGGCAVPIDSRLTNFEIENLARTALPRLSVLRGSIDPGLVAALTALGVRVIETLKPSPRGSAPSVSFPSNLLALDQPALVLFTSGSTGQPKGVVHTHRSLRARWMSLFQCVGIEGFARTLCLLPTHFGHGLICNCLFPWLSGQSLFIAPPFKPDLVMSLGSIIDEHQITFMSSVPTVWRLALKLAKPPSSATLQRVFCGSAPLSASLWSSVQHWTGTQRVTNAYGITETGSWVAGTNIDNVIPEDGLVGLPWGAVIRILKTSSTAVAPGSAELSRPGEPGHVWINTPTLMQGYLGRPDLTDQVVAQGWFYTGDIGQVDERGFLYLRGRERDEINRSGTKIHPSDIDVIAEGFPDTADVCTFGYADPLHGEDVGIAFVLKSTSDEKIRGLYCHLKNHLAAFQMPQRWYLVPEIPRTSRGKVNRTDVARRCAQLKPVDRRLMAREG